MPIIFRSAPFQEPFTFDSLGNNWLQDPVSRPNGYPFYHYLQTETGTGRVEADGKTYLLREGEGILLAPFIRHSYSRESDAWYTLFACFTGTVESVLPRIMENRPAILTGKEQGERIAALIESCMSLCGKRPLDERALSVNCYSILMTFVDGVHTRKLEQESPNILDLILGHQIDLVIDTPSQGVEHSHDGFIIRRNAIETGVNVLTAIDTAKALVTSLENTDAKDLTLIDIAKI